MDVLKYVTTLERPEVVRKPSLHIAHPVQSLSDIANLRKELDKLEIELIGFPNKRLEYERDLALYNQDRERLMEEFWKDAFEESGLGYHPEWQCTKDLKQRILEEAPASDLSDIHSLFLEYAGIVSMWNSI